MLKKPRNLVLSVFFLFLSSWICLAMAQNKTTTTIPVNVGVVLDINQDYGKIWLSCIKLALSDFYGSHAHYKTRLVLNIRDSENNVVRAADAALDLIMNTQVEAILGPVTSMDASFVINLGDQAQVPIISFSASSPSLTSLRSSYFFQITQIDSSQVNAISAIVHNFGWRQVVAIYVDTEYGEGVIPFLTDALQEVDVGVTYRSAISPLATDDQILQELYKLMTMQTRVFIVHMNPNLGSRLFAKAKEIGMMSQGYVWIMTNGLANRLTSMNSTVINSMQGALGVQTYFAQTMELEEFNFRWKQQFLKDHPTLIDAELDILALWAYDAAFALAMAVEEVGITSTVDLFRTKKSSFNLTDLENIEISKYGTDLCRALSMTRFEGIAGNFYIVDGQLQSSTFRIVNINEDGARDIGFWTPQNGLVNKLNSANTSILSTNSKSNLKASVIWPGDSLSFPKGWEIPTNGRKLRIGVPVNVGVPEFVKVTKDPSTHTTEVTGFSIDVFKAAIEVLPYSLPYEFIPFENPTGSIAATYNDLCYQNYDAVVGDVTIRANRSLYVDFTMPYTESGIVMVVPIFDTRTNNAWVFLKPLTWDLWLTTSCFFVLIGFVVWVLEHRINEDFRGPPSHQIGTSVWFSFSTMVFSQRERVVSNLGRFVMIIWVFVLLILTQSYTASLASLLTVQQLQPTVTDIKDLLRKGENVGYRSTAYTYDLLKQVGFDDSKLRGFTTVEEIQEALSKGSPNGGISAFVDETPYTKLLVAKYCLKFTMVGPIFKTVGFGFVFPKRSPLVPDVSQAVLNVTEGEKILNIENKWFNKQESNCQDSSNQPVSSNSLGLASFWGLFLIAGLASILALIIFIVCFLYEYRNMIPSDSGASRWRRLQIMFEIFNRKDLDSHTFKTSRLRDSVQAPVSNTFEVVDYNSKQTQIHSVSFEDQEIPSTDQDSMVAATEVAITIQEIQATTLV
ncbi:putative periplasmic binding protein-like I [Rosa chinensis]|uniref:Glutamate receptor n=1 Tax=Rosa chinensis TaxID=74649 RepID=A0A2P6PQG1_ROSCH|nr:putative periplasmic binding protein-like I [Rosa chinensis]